MLRTRNLGEADRIVTLYSPTHGKIEGVARGARRTRSRLIGATQIFTHGHYMLFSNRSLDTVSQAEIVSSFAQLREDLTKMAYASYLAELVDVSVEPGEPSAPLFQLLRDSFRWLSEHEESELVIRRFELHFMILLGYQPELQACVSCGQSSFVAERFSVKEGGLLCPACAAVDSAALHVTQATIEWLKRLASAPIDRVGVFRPTTAELKLIETVCRAYVDYRLARPLKSVAFLAQVQGLA